MEENGTFWKNKHFKDLFTCMSSMPPGSLTRERQRPLGEAGAPAYPRGRLLVLGCVSLQVQPLVSGTAGERGNPAPTGCESTQCHIRAPATSWPSQEKQSTVRAGTSLEGLQDTWAMKQARAPGPGNHVHQKARPQDRQLAKRNKRDLGDKELSMKGMR